MVEYHLWVTLKYAVSDAEIEMQINFIDNFKEFLKSKKSVFGDLSGALKIENGMFSFQHSEYNNHESDSVIELLDWICVNGPGSYGVLYILSHENDELDKVFYLKRGNIVRGSKSVFSPFIPNCDE